jgi:hypothetical protein
MLEICEWVNEQDSGCGGNGTRREHLAPPRAIVKKHSNDRKTAVGSISMKRL